MKTVAEGIEDEQSAALLSGLGVDCLQGYLFGKPMPLADFLTWLETRPVQPRENE